MRIAFPTMVVVIATAFVGGCAGLVYPELQYAKRSQKPIFVGNISPSKPNKKGSINALAQFFNTSAKTYKFVDITVEAYNRMGDANPREDNGSPFVKLRFTGPLAPQRTPGLTTWPKVWRSGAITCLVIKRIDIRHIDGTTITLSGPALLDVISQKLKQRCQVA